MLLLGPILLVWMLRKRFENRLDGRRIALSYIKATAAAVAAAIVGLWLRGPVEHLLGAELTPSGGHMNWLQSVGVCVVIGIVVIAVYVGALWGMHTEELVTMLSSLKARLASRRSGNAANVNGNQPAGDTATNPRIPPTLPEPPTIGPPPESRTNQAIRAISPLTGQEPARKPILRKTRQYPPPFRPLQSLE